MHQCHLSLRRKSGYFGAPSWPALALLSSGELNTDVGHSAMTRDPIDLALDKHRRGELEAARSAYAAILASQHRHPLALMGLGMIAHQVNDSDKALALLEEARRIAPRDPAILNNLGLVLAALGRDMEAQGVWRKALTIEPRFAGALVNLGNADVRANRVECAIARFRAALTANPHCSSAAANLGGLMLARRAYSEALRNLRLALSEEPNNADILVNIGRVLCECGLAQEARSTFESAVRIRPGDRAAASNLLLCLHYCEDIDANTIAEAHRAFGRTLEPNGLAAHRPAAAARADNRMRVGLLSGDFNDHSVMRFLAPVLSHRDRARVDLVCYYTGQRDDIFTEEARRGADVFRAVANLADTDLVSQVRADELDVLVDLAGHSSGGRPAVVAARTAPLQVSWLGYLCTSGLAAIDFRLTDAIADPPGLTESQHTEALWRLPAMWCYQPRPESLAVATSPASKTGYITFGSTNNPAKLSEASLSLWASVLAAVPGSRMTLHAHDDPLCRDRIRKAFNARAIAPDRLDFFGRESADNYLRRYATIDILLDTTPYSGGTTTCDSLWMGVPVLTLVSDRPFSRTSASVLHAAGYPQWVAEDAENYVRIARKACNDIPALEVERGAMRDRVARSRLCDGAAMTADFTGALESMWSAAGLSARASS
jgi:predicted O-linked N-acetylglucosamine transferase (SPINDLY family)